MRLLTCNNQYTNCIPRFIYLGRFSGELNSLQKVFKFQISLQELFTFIHLVHVTNSRFHCGNCLHLYIWCMSQIPDFIAGTVYIYTFGACHKFQISLQELLTFMHLVHVTNSRFHCRNCLHLYIWCMSQMYVLRK